jgi:hypothetical protein
MRDVSELLTGNLDSIPDGSGRKARTPSQSDYQIQDIAGNPFNPLTAGTSAGVSHIDIQPFYLAINGTAISYLMVAAQISALTPGVHYFAYFDDAKFAGGVVTLLATINESVMQGATGRFKLGSIITPLESLGGVRYRPTISADSGNLSSLNPNLAYDDDVDTFSQGDAYYVMSAYTCTTIWSGIANPAGTKTFVTLKIKSELVASSSLGGSVYYSLDGGGTWNLVYDQDTDRVLTTDSIALADGQDWSLVQVRRKTRAPAVIGYGGTVNIADIRIEGTLA